MLQRNSYIDFLYMSPSVAKKILKPYMKFGFVTSQLFDASVPLLLQQLPAVHSPK